ncbi:U-box domain-containing protein 11 [Apostasia shenzhenica]|uniref:U-box domain-containing protein 11 n=1 Tax=Apostasia shenzhenica TaxID=1088818 RepID=A0A2H9ZV32_9ASPA|nr:U-box domain-containing protein 11 [Apostasia shenzhenica]
MLAGAIVPITNVLRKGSTEARENAAAAAIFSLSLIDENKITIGGTQGTIEALVHGNKSRAVRAGILRPLIQILKDSSTCDMVDEVLTILSFL